MVAFAGSFLLALLMVGAVIWYGNRRPVGAPLAWGEAMMAATFIFFLGFWAYGVVPHQWLAYADNELRWRSDAILTGPGSTGLLKSLPIAINKQVARDIIAVLIYGLFLGVHIYLGSYWQNRAKKRAARAAAIESETTSYGRPLVKGT